MLGFGRTSRSDLDGEVLRPTSLWLFADVSIVFQVFHPRVRLHNHRWRPSCCTVLILFQQGSWPREKRSGARLTIHHAVSGPDSSTDPADHDLVRSAMPHFRLLLGFACASHLPKLCAMTVGQLGFVPPVARTEFWVWGVSAVPTQTSPAALSVRYLSYLVLPCFDNA